MDKRVIFGITCPKWTGYAYMAGGEEGALLELPGNAPHNAFDTACALQNAESHFTV